MFDTRTTPAARAKRTKCLSALVPQCLLLSLILGAAASGGEPPKANPGAGSSGTAVLNMTSFWRWHTVMRPPQTVDGAGKLTALKPAIVNYSQAGDALESPA